MYKALEAKNSMISAHPYSTVSMRFDAFAAPLAIAAVAVPFLFGVTAPPSLGFCPLLASWACMLLWLALMGWRAHVAPPTGAGGVDGRGFWGAQLLRGLLLAALLGAVVALLQYFTGAPGLQPWIQPSALGAAIGNLRQRNQQATLLHLGVWALLCLAAQAPAWRGRADGAGSVAGPLRRALWGGRRAWPGGAVAALLVPALALLAVALAATTSRTGALQWGVVLALVLCWRRRGMGTAPLVLLGAGLAVYLLAVAVVPELLWHWQGFRAESLLARFGDDGVACTSRRVLWANMLTLIAQKPWLGWGWGELDYAHYVTLFPGERFCVLLDNAHNLPLHLAVELGVPIAVLLCGGALLLVWRARPWREADPLRQLAWGVLAIVGLHSLLEFPLWYGPFQLVCLLALALLCWPTAGVAWRPGMALRGAVVGAWLGALVLGAQLAWSYHRVSQLYLPVDERMAAYRSDPLELAPEAAPFRGHVDFARLSATRLTPANAAQVHALARALLHYSPEPRVIQALIDSAALLGLRDEVAFHELRFRIAYPQDYARWKAQGAAVMVGASAASAAR